MTSLICIVSSLVAFATGFSLLTDWIARPREMLISYSCQTAGGGFTQGFRVLNIRRNATSADVVRFIEGQISEYHEKSGTGATVKPGTIVIHSCVQTPWK